MEVEGWKELAGICEFGETNYVPSVPVAETKAEEKDPPFHESNSNLKGWGTPLNAETQSAQRSEEEGTGTDLVGRARRGRNIGHGSRDFYYCQGVL